jgi:hypothetical protein
MMAMTTSSSISVNPDLLCLNIGSPPIQLEGTSDPRLAKNQRNDFTECEFEHLSFDLRAGGDAIKPDHELTVN